MSVSRAVCMGVGLLLLIKGELSAQTPLSQRVDQEIQEAEFSFLFHRGMDLDGFLIGSGGEIVSRSRFYALRIAIAESLNPVAIEMDGRRLNQMEFLLQRVDSQA